MTVWQDFFSALALVLIIEGILPFLSPNSFKETMLRITQMPEKNLRTMGFAAMLAGVLLLYLVRS
jgi:uncharacterized protein YjeT (DUF2065 family)